MMARLGTRLSISAGRPLVTSGNRGSEVLIVLSGVASCLVRGVEEARFGPGDFFGEVATLDGDNGRPPSWPTRTWKSWS